MHGAEIYNSKLELIHADYIDKELLKEIVGSIDEFAMQNNSDTKFYFVYDGEQYSTRPFRLPYNGKNVKVVKTLDELGENYAVGKLLICEEEKRLALQKFLTERFSGLNVELSGASYCDITNKNATKGIAIKHLSQMLNINLKNSVVFGDAENDKSMFEVVSASGGITIAVDNAVDVIKQRADYRTKSIYEDGFSYAVEKIVSTCKLFSS